MPRCFATRLRPGPDAAAVLVALLGRLPAARQVFGMEVQLCECLHQGSIAQSSVALGNEDLVEVSSLDPLQRHLQSSLAKQTPKASFRTLASSA